jgi:hypothetical protein
VRAGADQRRYPNFRAVLETGELQDKTGPGITFGLEVILSGLASHAG